MITAESSSAKLGKANFLLALVRNVAYISQTTSVVLVLFLYSLRALKNMSKTGPSPFYVGVKKLEPHSVPQPGQDITVHL